MTGDARRVLLLILDGLGIGAMDDAEEQDRGSHTLLHVFEGAQSLCVPNLTGLGLAHAAGIPAMVDGHAQPTGAYGSCLLRHPGADSYLGHQELMGSRLARVELRVLQEVRDEVIAALRRDGFSTEDLIPGESPIVVDGCAVVADSLEARRGLNFNVTGSLEEVPFERLTRIGESVRSAVAVPRIIVAAGDGFRFADIRRCVVKRPTGQIGVTSPELGLYGPNYQVRHFGLRFDTEEQLAARTKAHGQGVVLLGKAADVVECDGAERDNAVPTGAVLDACARQLERLASGLVVANVQETDLAGHEGDADRFRSVLEEVDAFVPRLVNGLRPHDALFVTGDHGNDPLFGHGQHTRERTPLMVTGPRVRPGSLGLRSTLSDVAATIAELLGVGRVPAGTSFAAEMR